MYLASYHGSPGFFKSLGKVFKKILPVAIGFATGGLSGAVMGIAGMGGGGAQVAASLGTRTFAGQPRGRPQVEPRGLAKPRMGQSGFYNIFGRKHASLTRVTSTPLVEYGRPAPLAAARIKSPFFMVDQLVDKGITRYTEYQMKLLSAQQRAGMRRNAMPYFTSAQRKAFGTAAGYGNIVGGAQPTLAQARQARAAFAPFQVPQKRRRMNVANPKALRRAIRRTSGFVKLARRALKGSGYRVVSAGSRRPSIKIQESGPGGVVVQK